MMTTRTHRAARALPRRTPRARRRGFALLFVMMLVALLGIGAAALLDVVNVDITIAAEHRKTLDAEAASVGAALEVVGEPGFRQRLPQLDDADLQTVLVDRNGTGYVRYPGDPAEAAIDTTASAHIRNIGTFDEDGYVADAQLLKVVARPNTTIEVSYAYYEVRSRASVSGGDAAREARVIVQVPVAIGSDQLGRQRHAR